MQRVVPLIYDLTISDDMIIIMIMINIKDKVNIYYYEYYYIIHKKA
jgi:hypothetical protein